MTQEWLTPPQNGARLFFAAHKVAKISNFSFAVFLPASRRLKKKCVYCQHQQTHVPTCSTCVKYYLQIKFPPDLPSQSKTPGGLRTSRPSSLSLSLSLSLSFFLSLARSRARAQAAADIRTASIPVCSNNRLPAGARFSGLPLQADPAVV